MPQIKSSLIEKKVGGRLTMNISKKIKWEERKNEKVNKCNK